MLSDSGIVRNRLKINAAVTNAQAYFRIKEKQTLKISKDLKARGFKFAGSTIVYAHMQATGMVKDHIVSCFRHTQVQK